MPKEVKKGQKQHYVPEVYLNNFSFDTKGNLYSMRIRPYANNLNIKTRNKSQICYQHNNYTILTDDFKIDEFQEDSNYIENKLFKYEEKFIKRITRKIDAKENLNRIDSEKLIRTILSIKNRNIVLKRAFQGSPLMKMQIKKEIEKIKASTTKYKLQNPGEYEEFIKLIEQELISRADDKNYMSDIYNEQLKSLEHGENDNFEWTIKELSKSKFIIYCTSESTPFLTSDNPGYTVQENDKFGNLFLGSAKAFAFPISKTRMLVIRPDYRDGNELFIKKLQYVDTPPQFMKLSNKAAITNSIENVYSNSEELLKYLKQNYDFELNQYIDK